LILKLIVVFSMAAFGTYHYFKIPTLINQKVRRQSSINYKILRDLIKQ
jgi:hypothetical protein